MSKILSAQELARLRQAMLLGAARQTGSVPEGLKPLLAAAMPARDPALTILALAGQQQRFQRIAAAKTIEAVPEAARRLHQDPRPILPGRARRMLLRLAGNAEKSLVDELLSIATRRVTQAGFRLHPFDLPRLIPHIKRDIRCLGLAERAFLALSEDATAADGELLDAEITAETWTQFPKAHRVAFLREERRRDPAEARAMLETVLRSEPAAMRADLLGALDAGLGVDDLPLLESLAADRAESVRSIAAALVARVPGTPAFAARLEAAARCFSRRGSAAIFDPVPLSANIAERYTILAKLFEGLSAEEVARAAGLTTSEVIGALSDDDEFIHAVFAARALRDGDRQTMMQLVARRFPADGGRRDRLGKDLRCLACNLAEPVSDDFGDHLIHSETMDEAMRRFQEAATPAAMKDDGMLVWTAAVLPPGLLTRFTEKIAPLSPATQRSARDFAELVLALHE